MTFEKKCKPTYDIEYKFLNQGYKCIIGVDEAGRGCLLGPVVAAAVIISEGVDTSEFNDSKKLSVKKREKLAEYIKETCKYSVSMVDAKIIDYINIREATKLAMRQVINNIEKTANAVAIIDGNFIPELACVPCEAIINGDALSVSIAAASIIAKVSRDAWVMEFHKKWPIYEVNNSKGYGTKRHKELLKLYGPSLEHRSSFKGVNLKS